MFDGGEVGLVDIGWHGAASASLVGIAAAQGTRVRCYFAGGLCGRESLAAPQDSRAYLIDSRGEEPELRLALVHLLETFCAGSGGSTLGYQESAGRWVPWLAPDDTNPAMGWGLQDYQELVRSYVSAACRFIGKYQMSITRDDTTALRRTSSRTSASSGTTRPKRRLRRGEAFLSRATEDRKRWLRPRRHVISSLCGPFYEHAEATALGYMGSGRDRTHGDRKDSGSSASNTTPSGLPATEQCYLRECAARSLSEPRFLSLTSMCETARS